MVYDTLQGINISHLGKRKIIFKMPFLRDMLVPWRVILIKLSQYNPLYTLDNLAFSNIHICKLNQHS